MISGNGLCGVYLMDRGTSGNVVEGDSIGTNAGGDFVLPNAINGVDIVGGASNNTLGATAGGLNIISGNTDNGIVIASAGTSGNVVEHTLIGTNFDGTAASPTAAAAW